MHLNRFYIAFTGVLLSPLIVMDLIFDDKQSLFMEMNHKIIIGTVLVFLIWGIGAYLLNRRYMVVSRRT